MKTTSYNFVDLMKYFMAILVILAHTDPFVNISDAGSFLTIYVFIRVAVPYFYIMSGFFLFNKMQEDKIDFAKIKKYLIRIFEMYVIWCLIYFPWKLHNALQNDLAQSLMIEFVNFLKGGFFHLYFLHVLMVAIILVALLLYIKISVNKIVIIASLFYILGLLSSSYHGLFQILFPAGTVFNEILSATLAYYPLFYLANGFIYVALGAAIALKGWRMEKKYIIIGLLLSWTIVTGEAYYTKYVANWLIAAECYVMLPAVVVLTALLSFEIHLPDNPIWVRLRKMSMYMYFVHPFWAWSIIALGVVMEPERLKLFFVTLIGSAVISYLILILKERCNWSWLNKLG